MSCTPYSEIVGSAPAIPIFDEALEGSVRMEAGKCREKAAANLAASSTLCDKRVSFLSKTEDGLLSLRWEVLD